MAPPKGFVPWNKVDRIKLSCQLCHSPYSVVRSQIKRSKYCSRICQTRAITKLAPRKSAIAQCHPERKHSAFGLCQECYDRKRNQADSRKNSKRAAVLKRAFNLTWEEYLEMLEAQDFKCKICKKDFEEEWRSLNVDHDHETGEVRGLLCSNCNLGIGHFKHDIVLLSDAIRYLAEK